VGVVLLAVAAIYTYVWFDARELSNRYPQNADKGYQADKFSTRLLT